MYVHVSTCLFSSQISSHPYIVRCHMKLLIKLLLKCNLGPHRANLNTNSETHSHLTAVFTYSLCAPTPLQRNKWIYVCITVYLGYIMYGIVISRDAQGGLLNSLSCFILYTGCS